MAAKKTSESERTYNVPLRKQFLKVAKWRRTEKAVTAVREFLEHHMKSKEVKLSKELNEELWKHGIKNPPHHIKVQVSKDGEGVVRAKLFGEKEVVAKTPKKAAAKTASKDTKPLEAKVEAATKTA